MSTVSSSPANSRATTAATAKGSPTFALSGTPRLRSGEGYDAATASSQASPHSPFLMSPLETGGDGLTSMLTPSGPSSVGPTHNLVSSASRDTTTSAALHPHDGVAHLELADARMLHRPASDHERALRLKETEIARLRRTVQELSAQLNTALHTLDERADTAAELQALKETNAAEQTLRDAEVRTVRLDMLESRVRFRSVETGLAARYDGDVQSRATELLAAHTKEVHEENFELLKEKLLLAQEVGVNRAEYKELQNSFQKLRRETQLDAEANTQLLQRSVQQKTQITALREQVKTCEDNLNAVVLEYDRKLIEQEKRHQAIVNTLTKERDDARRDALRLKRDLNQLRNSAGSVLAHRSELDDFFYAALEEVRRRVVEERHGQLAGVQPASAMEGGKTGTFTPAQTATTILRLETTERLLITGAPPALPTNTQTSQRAPDRRGQPKQSSTATSFARQTSSTRGSFNGSLLPPVSASSSRGPRSTPAVASLDGTLVSVPSATPAYLRPSVEAAHTSSLDNERAGGTMMSDACKGRGGVSGRHTAAPLTASNVVPAEEAELPPQPGPSTSPPPTMRLPTLRSLPRAPTWKDVKSVDVTQLSWADKERVLQLLFKRIQEERRYRARSQGRSATVAPGDATSADVETACFDRDEDSSTFLTQT